MSFIEWFRDFSVGGTSYHIVGISWFIFTFGLMTFHYLKYHKDKKYIPLSILFGLSTTILIHLVSDEFNFLLYSFSRADIVTAYKMYISIPDKYWRWFFVVPSCLYVLTTNRYDFDGYWRKDGFFKILIVTFMFGIFSIFTGMYGWRYTDPTNTMKFVISYLGYYILFAIAIFKLYPKRYPE